MRAHPPLPLGSSYPQLLPLAVPPPPPPSCRDVVTAPEGTSAEKALALLQQSKRGKLPLVNADGELVSTPLPAPPS